MEIRFIKQARLLLLAMLGSTLATLGYLIFIYDPLKVITGKLISMYPGSIASELFKEPPYDIRIRIFIYNVTNGESFLQGKEKLRFNEIGPYVYKEELFNINTTFNDNHTISFVPRRRIKFIRELSIGDPMEDNVMVPNIPLLGITAALDKESMWQNLAVLSATSVLGSTSFVNVSIHNYLYGYDDTLVTLANNVVPNWIDFPRFGILDRMMALDNGSSIVTMNISPKDTKTYPLYSIEKWNGIEGLKHWGFAAEDESQNSYCNSLAGSYLGSMFPPDLPQNASFRLYRYAFCRPVPIQYADTVRTNSGFDGYLYKVKENFLQRPESNQDNVCYFRYDSDLQNGLGDMSPCYYGIPIVMSQPHFLNADPILREQIDGMTPDKDRHAFTVTIHPEMGLPLDAKMRLQINLKIPNTKYNSKVIPFNNLVLPLFWLELDVDQVPGQIHLYITLLYHVLPIVQDIIVVALAVGGAGLMFGSAFVAVFHNFFNKDGRTRTTRGFKVNYSEIPVFPLKEKLLPSEVRIEK